MIRMLILSALLLAAPAMAQAASFNVTTLDTNYRICTAIVAADARQAFIACIRRFGIVVPTADAIVTTSRVCKSTHRTNQANGAVRYVYDRRLSHVTRPKC